MEETSKMLKRHKQRFLGELHVDQQKLRAQLEVLRSDVEAFAELGDIGQVLLTYNCMNLHRILHQFYVVLQALPQGYEPPLPTLSTPT